MDLSKSLEKVTQISSTQDRLVAYKELVNECINKDVPDQIQHLIDHLMQENVQPVLSRPAMEYLCAEIGKLKDFNPKPGLGQAGGRQILPPGRGGNCFFQGPVAPGGYYRKLT